MNASILKEQLQHLCQLMIDIDDIEPEIVERYESLLKEQLQQIYSNATVDIEPEFVENIGDKLIESGYDHRYAALGYCAYNSFLHGQILD